MDIVKIIITIIVSVVCAYLLGSINCAIIVTKIVSGKDIRDFGSSNAGMTNVLRNFGVAPAVFTLIGDFGKGILAVVLGELIYINIIGTENLMAVRYLCAFFVILGHMFPVFYDFKGGKGMLTSAGMLVIIDLKVFACVFGIFLIVTVISRYMSLGSICAAVAYPFMTMLVRMLSHASSVTIALHMTLAAMLSILIIFMHRGNIKRLLKGEEPKVKIGKKSKNKQ